MVYLVLSFCTILSGVLFCIVAEPVLSVRLKLVFNNNSLLDLKAGSFRVKLNELEFSTRAFLMNGA